MWNFAENRKIVIFRGENENEIRSASNSTSFNIVTILQTDCFTELCCHVDHTLRQSWQWVTFCDPWPTWPISQLTRDPHDPWPSARPWHESIKTTYESWWSQVSVLRYWPVTHVTHSHLLTHDPLSTLHCVWTFGDFSSPLVVLSCPHPANQMVSPLLATNALTLSLKRQREFPVCL